MGYHWDELPPEHFDGGRKITDGHLAAVINRLPTEGFRAKDKVANVPLAGVPGTPDAEAMYLWGQIEIHRGATIQVIHLHNIVDGSGSTHTAEVYRRRDDVMTLIATVSLAAGGGDFSKAAVTPIGDLAKAEAWDYFFMQLTSRQTAAKGLTVDIHFV